MKAALPGIVLAAAAALLFSDTDPAGKAWWAHVLYLADDKLEGRQSGTGGYVQAVKYVSQQFDSARLKPAGTKGYLQTVVLERRRLVPDQSTLEILREDVVEPLTMGLDAALMVRGDSGRTVEAGATFAGHALRIPEAGVDDLAGLDLKGKIAVVLRGAPKRIPGPLASHAQSTAEQWKALRSAGAIGVIAVTSPKRAETPWRRTVSSLMRPGLSLTEPELVDTAGQQVAAALNPAVLDQLLAGSEHSASELFALDAADKDLPRFPLKVRLRAKVTYTTEPASADNVVAELPGADSKLRSEYIVFSAHLDHLGRAEPANGGAVFPGAMDNASGIATLIEVAKALSGKKLKRSVVFAAVTGEENGLLGSRYFAFHPTMGRGRIVADLNTDMFLPIIPLKGITVLGFDESDLGPEFAKVSSTFGVTAERDPEPQRNGFIRSDQYSFIRGGIPAIALKFDARPGTPEIEVLRRWRSERYHQTADDLNQQVDLDSAARFNRIVTAFLEHIANRPERPRWNEDSFFRRFATR